MICIMMMDPNELAKLYLCGICKQLPKTVVAAEDGHFYCQDCIQNHLEANSSLAGVSPATGELMGNVLVSPLTIQSLINKLSSNEALDKKYLERRNITNLENVSDYVQETIMRAEGGSIRDMSILSRWYLFGEQDGIDSNEDKAYKWAQRAADLHDADGQAYLGYCFVHGWGIEKDKGEGN